MRFTFTERKINFSDDLRAYAEKKLGKLDKYFQKDATAHITAGIERGKHWLEVTVKYDNLYFRAAERSNDMYHAIDCAETTIDRQIRKNKTRLEKRLRAGAFERELLVGEPAVEPIEEETEFEIIRTKRFSVKPMTPEEAILQMNLLGHQFFVFKNDEDEERFSVVYKRDNGGYGLIENE